MSLRHIPVGFISHYKVTCLSIFIAVLFTIGIKWEQLKCQSSDEWIMDIWYIYTMIF